jgi:hypothetical protein
MSAGNTMKEIADPLDDLELNADLPSIAIQAAGSMLREHAELMSRQASEFQSIPVDDGLPDESWGSLDAKSFDIQEYGIDAIEQNERSDPIHEVMQLRQDMKNMNKKLRRLKKRLVKKHFVYIDCISDEGTTRKLLELHLNKHKRKNGGK